MTTKEMKKTINAHIYSTALLAEKARIEGRTGDAKNYAKAVEEAQFIARHLTLMTIDECFNIIKEAHTDARESFQAGA